MKLYEIHDAIKALVDEDGEIDPARLDRFELALQVKAEAIAKVIRNLEASEEAKREEAKRLTTSAVGDKARADWLKSYLKGTLESLALVSLDAGLFKVRIQKNSAPSVTYDGAPESLPERFQMPKIEVRKAALVDAWKRGEELPPRVKVEQGTHLRIS